MPTIDARGLAAQISKDRETPIKWSDLKRYGAKTWNHKFTDSEAFDIASEFDGNVVRSAGQNLSTGAGTLATLQPNPRAECSKLTGLGLERLTARELFDAQVQWLSRYTWVQESGELNFSKPRLRPEGLAVDELEAPPWDSPPGG
jgi:hypothetical protein